MEMDSVKETPQSGSDRQDAFTSAAAGDGSPPLPPPPTDRSESLTFSIVEGSSQRQQAKLIDSKGYSYTKYTNNKDGSVTWRCRRVRHRNRFCGITVRQKGGKFIPSSRGHNHPVTPGEHVTSQIVSQVKRKAVDSLFEPPDQIVNEVLIDNISRGNLAEAMPNPRNLARSAARVRQKQSTRTLVFDLTSDPQPVESDGLGDIAGCGYENDNLEAAGETTTAAAAAEEVADEAVPRDPSSPLVGTHFPTFEDVERFVQDHEAAHFVKFYKVNSRTVESSRRRLPSRYLSDHLRYASVVFACVHHGKHRSTSKGLRPRQKTLRMGCPAKFRFSVTPDGKQMVLSDAVTEHSHPHDEDSFQSLPPKRRLTDAEREEACHLLEQKQSKKLAQKLFQERTGKVLSMRDLHNLAALSKQQTTCYANIQAILDHLSQTEDQTSVVEVVTKADGRIVGVYFQDREMRRVYAAYPQYLVLDAACKYNSLRMPLYALLVEDGDGSPEVVGLFLVLLSNADSLRSMLLRFKEHNPAWRELQVLRADKDFAERQLLREEFPGASVQVCLAHVLRRFRQDLAKQQGPAALRREETAHLLRLMRRLATAKTEAAYMERYKRLLTTGLRPVIEYYNNNWHASRQEWVEGLKARSLVLKRDSPDKLEAVGQLLRDAYKDAPLAEQVMANLKRAVEVLREERDHAAASLLVRDPPPPDARLREFEEYLTPLALGYVRRQLKLSWKVRVGASLTGRSCRVKSSRGRLAVSADSCPCRFWRSLCLPCRHLLAVRRAKGLALFATEVIGSRWTMEHYRDACRFSGQEPPPGPEAISHRRLLLLSRQEKRDRIAKVTDELASVVAEAPVERFVGQLSAVQSLLALFRSGSSAVITEITSIDEVREVAGRGQEGSSDIMPAHEEAIGNQDRPGDPSFDVTDMQGQQTQEAAVEFQMEDQM